MGYFWSERRGQEGIHYDNATSIVEIQTPLYNPKNQFDTNKLNYYILQNFYTHFEATQETILCKSKDIDMNATIPKELEKYAFKARLVDMIDFSRADFNKAINLNLSNVANPFANSKFELVRLGNFIAEIQTAKRPKGGIGNYESGALSLGGEHIDNTNGYVKIDSPKYVPMEFYENFKKQDKGIVKENDILICKDGVLTGKIALVRDEFKNQAVMINEHIFLLRCDDLTKQKFLFYMLHSQDGQNLLKSKVTGSAQGGLNKTNLVSLQIPKPPLESQKQIVAECEKVEKQYQTIRMSIDEYKKFNKRYFY